MRQSILFVSKFSFDTLSFFFLLSCEDSVILARGLGLTRRDEDAVEKVDSGDEKRTRNC